MRAFLALSLVLASASGCDTAPGPAPLDQRPPELDEFSFFPQRVIYALLPAEQVTEDSIRVPVTIGVTARGQSAEVSEVRFVVQPHSILAPPVQSGILTPAGDSRYERQVTLALSALHVQTYTVLVYAVDTDGRVSGDVRGPLHYFRSFEPGSPPAIDSLAVPDTLQRPEPGQPAASLLLIAAVSDPDGLSDVALVEFWNADAPASRLLMCDDGGAALCGSSQDSGDDTAGDGLFTRRVFISSDNLPGSNSLEFQATDRAGLQSAVHVRDVVIQ